MKLLFFNRRFKKKIFFLFHFYLQIIILRLSLLIVKNSEALWSLDSLRGSQIFRAHGLETHDGDKR